MTPETPTERAGTVGIALGRGQALTTGEIMHITGLTRSGAWRLMDRLSRSVPLFLYNGKWQIAIVDGVSTQNP